MSQNDAIWYEKEALQVLVTVNTVGSAEDYVYAVLCSTM